MDQHDEITLGVLTAVESSEELTQRKIAQSLGIALGLANAYLKRCVRKGLIKIEQIPMRRYAYYLTPYGFAEKSRLTAEYLAVSFDFFRQARRECAALLAYAKRRNWQRVGLIGAGELAEVAVLSAGEMEISIELIVDWQRAGQKCAGKPVISEFDPDLRVVDALVFTAIDQPQSHYESIQRAIAAAAFPMERLLVPVFFRLHTPSQGNVSTTVVQPR
jgi:DNA-binding MarR family transcriptional regulator